jgi:hypothetical protein
LFDFPQFGATFFNLNFLGVSRMSRLFFRSAGLALAAAFALTAPAQAALIISFQFPGGATNQVVPETGGVYPVNIVASTNNVATTNIGINAGYIGALSAVLNGSTIGGSVTASSLTAGLGTATGQLVDRNGDGRIDLGNVNGIAKDTTTWMRPTTGGTSAVLLGGPTGVIGTFTVTIPPNASAGTNFLSFIPQLDPSGVGNDWQWTESNAGTPLLSGNIGGTVSVGSSVTFSTAEVIPEPGTLALGGLLLAGLAGLKLRRKAA